MDAPGAPLQLPVAAAVPDLLRALDDPGVAVLVAPPGTGKTTAVPPALLGAAWSQRGRIVVLEPRRLAARAAARRMAEVAGEGVGATYGYSVRGDRRCGPGIRVEMVTEGLLVRRLQSDPSLEGVSAVVLDEFHERSIDTDLALALLLDARASLRPDLRIVVMSATLDPAPVARLLGTSSDVPIIEVGSPMHPVEVRHRPGSAHDPLEQRAAEVVRESLRSDPGDLLVFLPGRPEIRRTRRALERVPLPDGVVVHDLHGSLSPEEQDEVIRPHPQDGRRVVLSTSLAETSITVPGVRVVIDTGRRRTVRSDPRTGLPALVTTAISRAGAAQRSGRAGRTAPGVAYRLWSPNDERHRLPADPPEIVTGDLAALLLQLRAWGVADPGDLRWLDPPPAPSLDAAEALLGDLGALDATGRMTAHGRELAAIGFHPRLAAVAAEGRRLGSTALAAQVVAVLETARSGEVDVAERVRSLRSGRADEDVRRAAREWTRTLGAGSGARRGTDVGDGDVDELVGRLLLAGYPDRVARRREGSRTDDRGADLTVFHLRTGGEVAVQPSHHPLAGAQWLVVADLDAGRPGAPGRVHLAAGLDGPTALGVLDGAVQVHDEVRWDPERRDVVSRRVTRLGAITVSERPLGEADPVSSAAALQAGLATEGLALLGRLHEADALRARVACLRAAGLPSWPDWSDDALATSLDEWLGPSLGAARHRADLDRIDVRGALWMRLDHAQRRRLDELAPAQWQLASGRRVPLRYGEVDGRPGTVLASARVREVIGTDVHPTVAAGRIPVTLELLSPAGRPVQRTTDLPGFWRGSYATVRSELRGRYPKHPWPERPWESLS